jgi:hypothetical protein
MVERDRVDILWRRAETVVKRESGCPKAELEAPLKMDLLGEKL